MSRSFEIAIDDPRAADVRQLIDQHLAFARRHSPPADVHALDADGLVGPEVVLFSARRNGELLGIGALKQLTGREGEVKSMHTAAAARGQGIGRALLDHLIAVSRDRGLPCAQPRDRVYGRLRAGPVAVRPGRLSDLSTVR